MRPDLGAGAPVARALDWRAHHRMVPRNGGRRGLALVDVLLSVPLTLLALSEWTFIEDYGPHPIYVANLLLCLGLALVQPLRLLRLRAVFTATYTLLVLYAALLLVSPVSLGLNPIIVTALTGLHAVVRWEPDRRLGTAALLLALAGAVANPVTLTSYQYLSDGRASSASIVLFSLGCMITVILTYLRASSRRRIAEDRDRDLAQAASQAVDAERLRLARELHDLVGHSLTTIKVQAATGLALGGEERLRSTLTTVRDTADDSLTSVRRLVSVLRSDAGDITPLADLRTIPVLIETTRGSGARINAVLPGPGVLERCNEGWSAIQRLTLVRLVGEALTNAVRHGSGQIELSLMLTPSSCHLHVSNPVSETVEHSLFGGSGLVGLEERLRLVGGTMSHGVQHDDEGSSFFILDVDFPVVPLELPASATDPDQNSGEMTGETGLGDSR